jgi:hypothetical protein
MMISEPCVVCGGDGRIANSFGNTTTCPGCHGSGRRAEDSGFRDVTKTKPSHHRPAGNAPAGKPKWPLTSEGARLATEVHACEHLAPERKEKLTRDIIDYEASHGGCTKTFSRLIRKQLRVP